MQASFWQPQGAQSTEFFSRCCPQMNYTSPLQRTWASHTLMTVSREALYSRPSPPHLTALMACEWLLMENRHLRVAASQTCTRMRLSSLAQSACFLAIAGSQMITHSSLEAQQLFWQPLP